MADTNKSWEKFLNPEALKGNLIAISLFITAFEYFKENIIAKPEAFFTDSFDESGKNLDAKYSTDVLSKSKSKIFASLLWLKEVGAIEQSDIEIFDSIRRHRNEVAHEPMDFLANSERNLDVSMFQRLIELLIKIEKWWFINFELAIDPDMLPEGANPDDVIAGPVWSLQLMLDIALGNEPESGHYYNAFKQERT